MHLQQWIRKSSDLSMGLHLPALVKTSTFFVVLFRSLMCFRNSSLCPWYSSKYSDWVLCFWDFLGKMEAAASSALCMCKSCGIWIGFLFFPCSLSPALCLTSPHWVIGPFDCQHALQCLWQVFLVHSPRPLHLFNQGPGRRKKNIVSKQEVSPSQSSTHWQQWQSSFSKMLSQ